MAGFVRRIITDLTSSMAKNQINENFQYIFYKLFGGIGSDEMKDNAVTTVKIANGAVDSIKIANASITNAHIQDATITSAKIGNAQINSANIGEAQILTAHIGDGEITNAKIADAIITNAKISNLDADRITGDRISANSIDTQHLIAGSVKATTIDANAITSDKINAKAVTTDKINSGAITTDLLDAQSITADKIQAGVITAGSTIIAEGAIGSAQISDLDVIKLNAGAIDTNKITLQGTDARLKITGNRLQVFDTDTNGLFFERVSLGDVNSDGTLFGLRVRGANGDTILMDELGVKREGITDGAITNDKIADDANISATKIDIATVVEAINNGETTISGSKIFLNDKTLDLEITNIVQANSDLSTALSDSILQISALSDGLSLKVSQSELTELSDRVDGYTTSLTQIQATADGLSVDVSSYGTRLDDAETTIDGIGSHLKFDTDGLTIKNDDSDFKVNINPIQMSLMYQDSALAYLSKDKMLVTALETLVSAEIGVHKLEVYDPTGTAGDEITLITWVG